MAKYRALRGVCIGVDRIATPDSDPFELDKGTAQFLTSIKAVAEVEEPALDAAPAGEPAPDNQPKGAKAPKKGT
jgi:hypothetical protein